MIEHIVPTPKHSEGTGELLTLSFCIQTTEAEWQGCCNVFAAAFEKIHRHPLREGAGGFVLEKDPALAPAAYRIEGAVVTASTKEGAHYGLATLLHAAEVKEGVLTLEKGIIEDYPDKNYRSLMIDLARQWHPFYSLLHYVDLCYYLKLNVLHLHFIDDQSYTLPSEAFPHLTDGYRYYTKEQIRELNAYAEARGIILVPEFEAPGHAKAMISQYPEIFGNEMEGDGGTITTESGAIVTAENLVCAGKQASMEGIRTLLQEICDLFPNSPYIHIGGDEANIGAWNYCSHCKTYMKEHGIEDEKELYSEFTGRVARMVLEMGRTPIVWEGFPPKGVHHIPKETIVCAWESHYHLAPDLLDAGFKIINGSWKPLYIVPSLKRRWGVDEILNWGVYDWQHWWPNSPARLNPIHVQPTDQLIGAQYSVWECTYEQEVGRVMDNLPAFSERTWNVERLWDTPTFLNRRRRQETKLALLMQEI